MSLNNMEVPPENVIRLFSSSKVNIKLFELFPSNVTSAIVTSVGFATDEPTKLPSKLKAVPPLTP